MYAIVETGGKQYQMEEGKYLKVELLDGEKDSKVVFDKVVTAVSDPDVCRGPFSFRQEEHLLNLSKQGEEFSLSLLTRLFFACYNEHPFPLK